MPEELICIGCQYSLRGLEPDGKCPECGLEVMHSIYGQDNAKLHAYEERVLARAIRYRSHRGHAYGFAFAAFLCAVFVFIGLARSDEVSDATIKMIFSFLVAIPFWLVLAHAYHVRVKHVESIEQARRQLARAYGVRPPPD